MKISDLLRLSFNNLKRRKGRTFLTVLGVVIGTCSIVLMVSIGVALSKSYDDMLSGWGDLTAINVYKYGSSNDKNDIKLTDAVIDSFLTLPNVTIATPIYSPDVSLTVKSGSNDKYQAYGSILAMRKSAIEAYGFEVNEGRLMTSSDKAYTVLFGEKYAYQFENTKSKTNNYVSEYDVDENGNAPDPFVKPMHDKFKIVAQGWAEGSKSVEKELTVAGVLKGDYSKGYQTLYGIIMDIDDVIAIEREYNKLNNVKTDKKKEREYTEALVKVADMKDVEAVDKAIKDMGFETYTMASVRDELKKETQTIELILGGLGGIAMLVSAISIANTMTMAIYERTKEIGVMKVLGCELSDIKNMFLAEAAGIGFLGGTVGLAVSYGISALLNTFMGSMMGGTRMSIIPLWLALFGLAFSTLVGIISGYVPAVKAVKITALSAIRHE